MAPRCRAPATSKTTIASLPTELITRVVELSTPEPGWAAFPSRLTHLRSLALVCRKFRGPAQEELFRHLFLSTVVAARLFVKSRASARFASTTRSLRAGTRALDEYNTLALDQLRLPFILRRCPRLQDAWMVQISELNLAEVTSGTGAPLLSRMEAPCKLTRFARTALIGLYCHGCCFTVALESQKRSPPVLERLGVSRCDAMSNMNLRSSFSHLRSLSLLGLEDGQSTWALEGVAAQLTSLCLDDTTSFDSTPITGLSILDFRECSGKAGRPLPFVPAFRSSAPPRRVFTKGRSIPSRSGQPDGTPPRGQFCLEPLAHKQV